MSRREDDYDRDEEIVAQGKLAKSKSFLGIIVKDIIIRNFNEVKTSFVNEVLVPQTMDWLYGLCSNFLCDVFQTTNTSSGRKRSSFGSGFTDYSNRFSSARSRRARRDEREEDIRDYEDIQFDTRQDAERVLSKMRANIERYDGSVTIRDLFSFCGLKSSWTDEKYGWTKLDKARAYRGRDGYFYLDLPEPFPIEDD